jgi:hypothetical protein
VPGWKAEVTESKLPTQVQSKYGEIAKAVTKITWSGGKIEPHQFQEFEVSLGGLPEDTDQLMFPATQTYSNGEVVKWDDEPKADGSEAERPVPTLKLVAPSGDDEHGAAGASHDASASPGAPAASEGPTLRAEPAAHGTAASDGTARLLAGAGLATGVLGLVVAGVALRRGRGTPSA